MNGSLVIVARHFQYRVELLFKVNFLDEPLVNRNYYAARVHFQVCGSPHVHFFTWILNASYHSRDKKPFSIEWLHNMIRNGVPDGGNESELLDYAKNSKIHRHTKTSHKFKNKCYSFHYGRYFTDHAIAAEPLVSNTAADVQVSLVEKRNKFLGKATEYTHTHL